VSSPLDLNEARKNRGARILGGATVALLALYSFLTPAPVTDGELSKPFWDGLFWLMVLNAFIRSWWAFESLFRNEDGRRLVLLPIRAESWSALALKNLGWGLLMAEGMVLAVGIRYRLAESAESWLIHSAVLVVFTWALWGGLFGFYTHLLASIDRPGHLRDFLKSGLPSPEAALLFYGPAFGFAGGLVLSLFMLFGVRVGMGKEDPAIVLMAFCAPFLIGTCGLYFGQKWFAEYFPRSFPSFVETERVMPFSERELLPIKGLQKASEKPLFAWKTALQGSLHRAFKVDGVYIAATGLLFGVLSGGANDSSIILLGAACPLIYPFLVGGVFRRLLHPELFPSPVWKPGALSPGNWIRGILTVGLSYGKGIPTLFLFCVVAAQSGDWRSATFGLVGGIIGLGALSFATVFLAWRSRQNARKLAGAIGFLTFLLVISAAVQGG